MAIRVFEVDFDADRFQCLFVDSADEQVKERVRLDGTPKGLDWVPAPVYVDYLNLEEPDIWWLYEARSMVLSRRGLDALHYVLLEAELLRLPAGDRELTLVNVVEVRNYLDTDKTKWFAGIEGLMAEVPEFVAHRIGGPSLFKLPNNKHVRLYCWEQADDPSDSFRHVVLGERLTGLTFEEIWNSETGGRRPSSVPGR